MKKSKFAWIVSVFFLLSAFAFFPSFSSILMMLAGVLMLPISFIQSKLAFYLKKPLKVVAIIALVLLALIFLPASEEPAVENDVPVTTIERTEEPVETVVVTAEAVETTEFTTESVEETVKEVSFNESFINTYVPMGVPTIMVEYKKLEEAGEYDVLKALMFRNHQKDESVPVLEEQMVSGDALVIGTSSFSDEGTTTAELYLGTYDFDYKNGIIPAKEKLLAEHPEEWCKFVSIVSGSYMQIEPGDLVAFEGTIYGIQNDEMSIRGTCNKK